MPETKKYFYLKLNSPRPSFLVDMTEEEKLTMGAHISYWAPFIESGLCLVIGPVLDPAAPFGVAIVRVDSQEELDALIANDPANSIGKYDIFPMRANTKF